VTPTKLKDDAILEALCQVRFSSPDMPEVIVGRLSDFADARSYDQRQLPLADIPAPVRRNDPNLKYQPLLQLAHRDGRLIQIGESVLSAHSVGAKAYPGWVAFRQQLHDTFARLYDKIQGAQVNQITLRYINALVVDRHHIKNPHSLKIDISIAGARFGGPINLNFVTNPNDTHIVTTRIADTNFVQGGPMPKGTSAVVDVEVSTSSSYKARSQADVYEWIETAHTLEKEAFFKLLPDEVIEKLKEN